MAKSGSIKVSARCRRSHLVAMASLLKVMFIFTVDCRTMSPVSIRERLSAQDAISSNACLRSTAPIEYTCVVNIKEDAKAGTRFSIRHRQMIDVM